MLIPVVGVSTQCVGQFLVTGIVCVSDDEFFHWSELPCYRVEQNALVGVQILWMLFRSHHWRTAGVPCGE